MASLVPIQVRDVHKPTVSQTLSYKADVRGLAWHGTSIVILSVEGVNLFEDVVKTGISDLFVPFDIFYATQISECPPRQIKYHQTLGSTTKQINRNVLFSVSSNRKNSNKEKKYVWKQIIFNKQP